MSKNLAFTSIALLPGFFFLIFISINLYFCSDEETLAERAAKRARTSTGDEPPARPLGEPAAIETSPEPSPRRSPRRSPRLSPQRESITLFPLASAGEVIFTANILRRAGAERQQESPARVIPDVPSSSAAPPTKEPSEEPCLDDVDTCKLLI